jgi:hypothetical protein
MLTMLVCLTAALLFAVVLTWLLLQLDGERRQRADLQTHLANRKPTPTYHLSQEHREPDAA